MHSRFLRIRALAAVALLTAWPVHVPVHAYGGHDARSTSTTTIVETIQPTQTVVELVVPTTQTYAQTVTKTVDSVVVELVVPTTQTQMHTVTKTEDRMVVELVVPTTQTQMHTVTKTEGLVVVEVEVPYGPGIVTRSLSDGTRTVTPVITPTEQATITVTSTLPGTATLPTGSTSASSGYPSGTVPTQSGTSGATPTQSVTSGATPTSTSTSTSTGQPREPQPTPVDSGDCPPSTSDPTVRRCSIQYIVHARAFSNNAWQLVNECTSRAALSADDEASVEAFVGGSEDDLDDGGGLATGAPTCDALFSSTKAIPSLQRTYHRVVNDGEVAPGAPPFYPFAVGSPVYAVWTTIMEAWVVSMPRSNGTQWFNVTLEAPNDAAQISTIVGMSVNGRYVVPSCAVSESSDNKSQLAQCSMDLSSISNIPADTPTTLHIVTYLTSSVAKSGTQPQLQNRLIINTDAPQAQPPFPDLPFTLPMDILPQAQILSGNGTDATNSNLAAINDVNETRPLGYKVMVLPADGTLSINGVTVTGTGDNQPLVTSTTDVIQFVPSQSAPTTISTNSTVVFVITDIDRGNVTMPEYTASLTFFTDIYAGNAQPRMAQPVVEQSVDVPFEMQVSPDNYANGWYANGSSIPPLVVTGQLLTMAGGNNNPLRLTFTPLVMSNGQLYASNVTGDDVTSFSTVSSFIKGGNATENAPAYDYRCDPRRVPMLTGNYNERDVAKSWEWIGNTRDKHLAPCKLVNFTVSSTGLYTLSIPGAFVLPLPRRENKLESVENDTIGYLEEMRGKVRPVELAFAVQVSLVNGSTLEQYSSSSSTSQPEDITIVNFIVGPAPTLKDSASTGQSSLSQVSVIILSVVGSLLAVLIIGFFTAIAVRQRRKMMDDSADLESMMPPLFFNANAAQIDNPDAIMNSRNSIVFENPIYEPPANVHHRLHHHSMRSPQMTSVVVGDGLVNAARPATVVRGADVRSTLGEFGHRH